MEINWIDMVIIFVASLYLTIRETIPAVVGRIAEDSAMMIFVLAFFRFAYYAVPLYVADIVFVPFIVNTLNGHPFVYVQSFSNDVLRFMIVFGMFGLAKIIYPRVIKTNPQHNNSSVKKNKSVTEIIFIRSLNKIMNQSFIVMVIYVCILLAIVIPVGLYALFVQGPPASSCWPF